MSGLFGSTTIKGTRLTDFSGTSAEVGKAIAFGYGSYPVDGYIGWAPLPPVEHRKVKRQGKGGVKQETFTYTMSYAVFFGKGPIKRFRWIKRQGKVVYTTDPDVPVEDAAYAAKWAERVNFHYGTPGQLPDSLIEAYEGVGNVSSFPNSCLITLEDEDLTDNGGAPANYEACVVASGYGYATTPPYPYVFIEGVQVEAQAAEGKGYSLNPDGFGAISVALDGTLSNVTVPYTDYDPEAFAATSVALDSQLNTVVVVYADYDPEAFAATSVALDSQLNTVALVYENYDPESIDISSVALDGTLEEV